MRLFGKVVRVTVAGLKAGVLTVEGRPANALQVDKLQVRFHVKKSLTKHPNKAVVKITGLSPTSRAQLNTKPLRLILHAGYDDTLKLLFDGDVDRIWPEREGATDVVTEIHAGDGSRSYSHARLERSYRPPVPLSRVLTDAAAQMGMPLPDSIRQDPRYRSILESGFSSSAHAHEVLDALLHPLGYSWSSQNRQLVVLTDSGIRPGQDAVISAENGLIGSPKLKESDKAGGKATITTDNLLYPELAPGVGALIRSEFVTQRVKLQNVTHKGDTHGDDWNTEAQGTPA